MKLGDRLKDLRQYYNLTQEEFDLYHDKEEKLFGILIKKDSDEYVIGKIYPLVVFVCFASDCEMPFGHRWHKVDVFRLRKIESVWEEYLLSSDILFGGDCAFRGGS